MNHNQQQNNFMQDNDLCEHEFRNVSGVGKVCTRCGEGTEYQKRALIVADKFGSVIFFINLIDYI